MPDEDVRIQLARMEGKIDTALQGHSVRLDEHSRILDQHDIRIREVAEAQARSEGSHKLPNWVPVLAAVAGVCSIIAAVIIAILKG